MSTSRLETFSDGVFAIAATLLILNVGTQIPSHVHDLGARLLHIWPPYVAALLYGLTLVATAVMFSVSWFYAAHRGRLLRPDATGRWSAGSRAATSPAPGSTWRRR